jgi:phenylacetate-coenzyme A ligase PaaK-like adenylate-forming protein
MTTEELATKQTKDMEAQLPEQVQALSWSSEKIKNIRQLRLRQLLTHSIKYSPWYKKQLAHINVENFTEKMLDEIPVLDKTTLMEHWDEIITHPDLSLAKVEKHIDSMLLDDNVLYFHNRFHVMATGGSSGKRGVFIYDWDEWNTYYLLFRRYRLYNNMRSPVSLNATKKISICVVAASNAIHGTYSLTKTYKLRNSEIFHFPITLPIQEIVDGLNSTRPDVLQGAPSTLYKLCKEVEEGRLNIHPEVLSVFGEAFYPILRQALQKTWPDASIFNTFGTSEGLAGITCTANREEMHLNDDLCIVEPVDERGNSVNPGVLSTKIYITNLFNYTLPLIRYEISDQLLFLNKICDCGIRHQLIAEPQNRFEFDFIYPGDISVHHITFVSPLLHDRNIQEYQIFQTKTGADIKMLTTGPVNIGKLKDVIVVRLKKLGLSEPIVNFIEVAKFDYPPSGKFRRFIALPQ